MGVQLLQLTAPPIVLVVLQRVVDFIDGGFRTRLVTWFPQFLARVHAVSDYAQAAARGGGRGGLFGIPIEQNPVEDTIVRVGFILRQPAVLAVHDGTTVDGAWKSLDRVNKFVSSPGDRLLFKAGSRFVGRLTRQGSGKKGAPIVIDRFGKGDKPRIDCQGRFPEVLMLRNQEYWEINNLELTNHGKTREANRHGIKIIAEDCGTLHHIRLRNLFLRDVNGSNVKGKGEGHGIWWIASGENVQSRFDGLFIEGCHLVRVDRNGIRGSGHWGPEDRFMNLNVVIRNNLIEDVGGDAIIPIATDGCLIEYNVARKCRQRCNDYAAGIWPWACDNTIMQFNEVSQTKGLKDGQGFDIDSHCNNTIMQFNYSYDNDGGVMLIMPRIGTAVVRYNISQNDGERIFHINRNTQDTQIYNNMFHVGAHLHVMAIMHTQDALRGVRFMNNIFYVEGKMLSCARITDERGRGDGTYDYAAITEESAHAAFHRNVFFHAPPGMIINPPNDPSAILSDPMFENPGTGRDGLASLDGYRLRGGSPCLGAGLAVEDNGGRDFWGNQLPRQGNPDIGAHQRTRSCS